MSPGRGSALPRAFSCADDGGEGHASRQPERPILCPEKPRKNGVVLAVHSRKRANPCGARATRREGSLTDPAPYPPERPRSFLSIPLLTFFTPLAPI